MSEQPLPQQQPLGFWESFAVSALATVAGGLLLALIVYVFRRQILLWWVARDWVCERCGESVPYWFGTPQYELSNRPDHPPTVTLICAVCERNEVEYPTPLKWIGARRRALLRRRRGSRMLLGVGEVLDPNINKAMREAERARLAKVKEGLK